MTRLRNLRTAVVALASVYLLGAADAGAQTAENVAVVINDNSAASQLIGQYYARKRGVPAENVIRIHAPVDETVDRPVYVAAIEQAIAAGLAHGGLQDRILYIVLTKGVPLRIRGSFGGEGTGSSVDSELTLLYRRMTGRPVLTAGRIMNPYFLGATPVHEARRFSHREYDMYLVTRLDAFTVEEVTTLIDAAVSPASDGRIVLDQRGALVARTGEEWLAQTADAIRASRGPERVVLETTPKPAAVTGPILGYYAWGSTDPQLRKRSVGMHFQPGSIAATFAGADARTFEPPPQSWAPMSEPSNRSTWFAGSPQSLVGDLIREGATGVAGNVAEPFLEGVVRPNVLFPAYLGGFNLAESFYLATPYLSWQTVIVGDPLCQPFSQKPLARADTEPPVDPATELPSFFSERRMALVTATTKGDAKTLSLLIRAETRLDRGDRSGGRALLGQVVAAAPALADAQMQLAVLDDEAGEREAANTGYRRVLELEPNNEIALNNLAYNIAVYRHTPADARPLAVKAVTVSKRNPLMVDTLGWIEHLSGNTSLATMLLAEAVRGAPANADIRLHAAIAFAASGDKATAGLHLKEALRRNPALERQPDVQALRERLGEGAPNH